jgi:hypothetical protein
MNAEQVGRLLGVSAKTVHRHIAKGTIIATYKHTQELEITEDQVDKLRQVLASDKSRRESDISQTLLSRLSTVEQKLALLEQEIDALKKAHPTRDVQAPMPPVSTMPVDDSSHQEKASNRIVGPKRTYTKKKASGLPETEQKAADDGHLWYELGQEG